MNKPIKIITISIITISITVSGLLWNFSMPRISDYDRLIYDVMILNGRYMLNGDSKLNKLIGPDEYTEAIRALNPRRVFINNEYCNIWIDGGGVFGHRGYYIYFKENRKISQEYNGKITDIYNGVIFKYEDKD